MISKLKITKELTNLNSDEINNKIIELKKELIILKVKKTTKQTVKPHIIKKIKYKISQMLKFKQIINK
uniref:Large ribosomal subunit protein uL29c n=1 Tax=Bostrychia moritziana TaxID=103713 RepID=A0A1Z1M6I1_BOSMO|nr:ribosomal protein L29 [Bostrychia moritziana]ARW61707.1 ribosomal protein L29 [Bostrychia moritziana]